MKTKKSNHLENYLSFFAWFSGMLVSLVVGYAVLAGPIQLPEILGNHLFSNIIGWAIIITTIVTIVLSFFRK